MTSDDAGGAWRRGPKIRQQQLGFAQIHTNGDGFIDREESKVTWLHREKKGEAGAKAAAPRLDRPALQTDATSEGHSQSGNVWEESLL
jgi:hypothetical protein